jgi:pre-mRNA-processing factor SLU7
VLFAVFAWEASEHGTDIHPNVDPTKLELMYKEFRSKKKNFKNEQQQSILEKYGGEEHLDAPPKEMLLAQTEHYVEYSRTGAVIKGQERAKVKSRYEEDVFINNHTSVWGSYWVSGKWGFACCHSLIKNSFCTGEAGKRAARSGGIIGMSRKKSTGGGDSDADEHRVTSLVEQHKKKLAEMSKEERKSYQKSLAKGSEEELKEDEIQKAMKALAEREREAERLLAMDERKRPYNSMKADFSRMPTEEEMEAFRLKRRREDDPMADFLK